MRHAQILKQVQNAYNLIATEWDATRDREWPEFHVFLAKLKKRNLRSIKLLDLGCGNGRLAGFLKNEPIIDYIGVDNSRALLKIAKKNHPNAKFRYANAQKLPSPAKTFDAVWCIAVLHHLPGETLQLKVLQEIRRVLKKNGIFMFTVWDLWQPRYQHYIDATTNDAFIPFGTQKTLRFYHAFEATELRTLLQKAGFTRISRLPSPKTSVGGRKNVIFSAQ